jgi:8-oxo-dGTP pyrophosphatase MutT (NUDIX family)
VNAPRRPAAVVLGIGEVPPHGVIFIERAAHLRNHAGQIGLPGGGMDPGDEGNLRATALREMAEEVGVAPGRVTIVGELPVIKARVNNYAVTPFVATVAPPKRSAFSPYRSNAWLPICGKTWSRSAPSRLSRPSSITRRSASGA